MKKSLCVVFALLMCVAVFFTGCDNTSTPGGVVDASGDENIADGEPVVNVQSDNKIEEGETTVEENLGLGVETFLSGTYFLEGVVYSEGEVMPVLLATDGKNYQFTASYSSISFGMLLLDEATYMVLPKAKQYTPLSEKLISALDLESGLGVDDFQTIKNDSSNEKASISQYSVTINGDAGLCTLYTFEDSVFKLYSIGDQLIQVENCEKDGTLIMQIVVDSITSQIPADQLTLKGLEEASVTSFIQAFMSSMAS